MITSSITSPVHYTCAEDRPFCDPEPGNSSSLLYRCFRQTLLCPVSMPFLCLSIFSNSSVFSSPALPQCDWQMSVPLSKCLSSRQRSVLAGTLCCSLTAAAAVALPSLVLWTVGSVVIIFLCNRQCRCFSCSICRSTGGRYWLQTGSCRRFRCS